MALERYHPNCCNINCPLDDSCSRVATKVIRSEYQNPDDPVDVLIIADCPSSKEMQYGISFLGPERDIIESVVNQYAHDKTIAYTYLVRGWPIDRSSLRYIDKPIRNMSNTELSWAKTMGLNAYQSKKEIVSNCIGYLVEDINVLKPKLIIVLGNNVKEALFPTETKSLLQLCDVYRDFNSIPVRFMPSHLTIVSNPSSQTSWKNQLAACLTHKVANHDTTHGATYILKNYHEAIDYLDALRCVENDISIDCETLNTNKKYGNKIATIQFSETNNSGIVLPYNHIESPFNPEELEKIRCNLFDLFSKKSKIRSWVGHALKFECNIFKSIIGSPLVSAPMYDTMCGAFLLDENRRERASDFRYGIYSLKQLAYEYVNWDGYDKGILKERKDGNLFDLPLQDLASYGSMDTYITRRLMHSQIEWAKEQNYDKKLFNLMYYLYSPMILLFSDIEQNGFYADRSNLRKLISKESLLLAGVSQIENEMRGMPEVQRANDILLLKATKQKVVPLGNKPWVFDLNKGEHPQTLFFNSCCLPQGEVGKSGIASVDSSWQEQHKSHPLVKMFMDWSELKTLYNVFASKLYNRIDPSGTDLDSNIDCRIRPDFNLTKAVTGRIACEKPNLQNIPRADTPAKKSVKNIFRASKGKYLIQLDYKANEIRWVGILAQDDLLAKAIWQGKEMMDLYRKEPSEDLLKKVDIYGDIHKQTAAMVFNKIIEDVTKDERQISKSVVFAILYGSSTKAVANARGKSVEEVEKWFSQFYERFPKIAQWKQQTEKHAKMHSYIEASHGRRRRLPIFDLFRDPYGIYREEKVSSEYLGKVNSALRQCVNSPIQGIASDNGMCAAALFSKYIRENNKPWTICNAVHDSCVWEVPFNNLEESLDVAEKVFTTDVMEYMANVFNINFNLPLEVDFEIGLEWGNMLKWNFAKDELVDITKKLQESLIA